MLSAERCATSDDETHADRLVLVYIMLHQALLLMDVSVDLEPNDSLEPVYKRVPSLPKVSRALIDIRDVSQYDCEAANLLE